jgi:hypothetical protein
MREVVIPDPELLLPDEKLPSDIVLVARSAFIGGEYVSLAALVARRKKAEARLSADMQEWQRLLEPPCWVVYSVRNDATGERMLVYGAIPDMDRLLASGRVTTGDLTALRRLRRKIENGSARGWLYGQWFSRTQPEGEWGTFAKAFIQAAMSEAEFEAARARGWEDE